MSENNITDPRVWKNRTKTVQFSDGLTPWEINKDNQPLIRRRDPLKIRLWVYDHTPTWYVLNERIISGSHYIPTYQLTDRESSAKGIILK